MNDLTLKKMFNQIEEYQCQLSPDISKASDQEKLDRATICSLALYQEVSELVDSFGWKPWRKQEDQPLDIDNLEREAIDIIFFLAQITRCFGITPEDLESRFKKVLENNKQRLQNGYSKITIENDKNVNEEKPNDYK